MRKASFDLANLLFLLILLLLLIICCCICYSSKGLFGSKNNNLISACVRRHHRVQPVTQQAAHTDGVPSATPQPVVVTQTQPATVITVDRSISPTVTAPIISPGRYSGLHMPTLVAIPKTTTERPRNNMARAPTPPPSVEPVPVIIGAVELPTNGNNWLAKEEYYFLEEGKWVQTPPPVRAPVTVVNEIDTETAILPARKISDVVVPEAKPRSLPPLQMSSTSPYQTMNTRLVRPSRPILPFPGKTASWGHG